MVKAIAEIIKKDCLQSDTYSFVLKNKQVAQEAKPGQFINILVDGFTLRRPISICEIFEDSIRVVFAVRGKGTAKMAEWNVGTKVDIVAPLGHGFKDIVSGEKLLVVGGGIGTPPLLELAKRSDHVKAILGFRNKDMVILEEDYKKQGTTIVCTDDGSYGENGFVTKFLIQLLETEKFDRIAACGPKPMLKAIAEIANQYNVFCEISLEERMACGVGACLGCQCIIEKDGKKQTAHVCKDGPVFKADEVLL